MVSVMLSACLGGEYRTKREPGLSALITQSFLSYAPTPQQMLAKMMKNRKGDI
jgi:hypothetical protein